MLLSNRFFLNALDKILRLFLSILSAKLCIHYLGVDYFGSLSFGISVWFLFQAFIIFGVDGFFIRDVAKETASNQSVFNHLVLACILSLVSVFILLMLYACNLLAGYELIVSLSCIFSIGLFGTYYLIGAGMSEYYLKISMLVLIISFMFRWWAAFLESRLLYSLSFPMEGLLMLIATMPRLISAYGFTCRYLNWNEIYELTLKYAPMFAGALIMILINRGVIFISKPFVTEEDLGRIAFSLKLFEVASMLGLSVLAIYSDRIYTNINNGRLVFPFSRTLQLVFAFVAISFVLFFLFGDTLIELFFGGEVIRGHLDNAFFVLSSLFVILGQFVYMIMVSLDYRRGILARIILSFVISYCCLLCYFIFDLKISLGLMFLVANFLILIVPPLFFCRDVSVVSLSIGGK